MLSKYIMYVWLGIKPQYCLNTELMVVMPDIAYSVKYKNSGFELIPVSKTFKRYPEPNICH